MKNLKKKFASQAGFTLVELVVVIAILAILAAVAVPTYSGYITKANEAADYSQLDAIKTAAVFVYTDMKKDQAKSVVEIKVTADNGTISKVTVKGEGESAATTVYNDSVQNLKTYHTPTALKSLKLGATWTNTSSTWNANTSGGEG